MGHNTKYIPPRTTKSFIGLLTQSGGDNTLHQSSGTLTVGVTYRVIVVGSGDNFVNVGLPNSFLLPNNYFVATGETPTTWTHGTVLQYNAGAPVLLGTIEDTFRAFDFDRDAGFYLLYYDIGKYYLKYRTHVPGVVFPKFKTIGEITNPTDLQNSALSAYRLDDQTVVITTAVDGELANGRLGQNQLTNEANYIKVTVYLT